MPEITKGNPFSMEFVLKTTTKHMRKSIEISIKKTSDRLVEFAGVDEAKSVEVFQTMLALNMMKKNLNDSQANAEKFRRN
jgi:hypothetical protein